MRVRMVAVRFHLSFKISSLTDLANASITGFDILASCCVLTITRTKAESAFINVLFAADSSDAVDADAVEASRGVDASSHEYRITPLPVEPNGFHTFVHIFIASPPFPSCLINMYKI